MGHSIIDIKRAIPNHCFRSSLFWSVYFVFRSLFFVSFLGALLYTFDNWYVSIIYAYLQGTVFWGIFTIGHDCGHGAFSAYPWINWIVGNILHSLILTPYEPWRQSHRSHHKNTCNADKDEIFYPKMPKKQVTFGCAWFLYLIFSNVSGRRNYLAYFSAEFKSRAGPLALSFASLFIVIGIIIKACFMFGTLTVFLFYGAPLFVFASWLVIVTFLHHNDENCPWYPDNQWTALKGSLSAVDRDYGWLVNNLSHNIHLHQIHHLFPKIPHYHLAEATDAFKRVFPELYCARGGSNLANFARGIK